MRMRPGSMLMEAVLVLPILIAMICGIFQLSGIAMARVMTEYAAYEAARAMIVASKGERSDNVHQAAARALAPVSGTTKAGLPSSRWAKNAVSYPGWGDYLGTAWLDKQVTVTVEEKDVGSRSEPAKYQLVTVQFDYPLTVPVAGAALAAVLPNGVTLDGVKTVRMQSSACAVGWTDDIYPRIAR